MNGNAAAMVEKQNSTRPVITSVSTSGMPRNGTCTPSNPAEKRKRSVVKWVDAPTQAAPKVIAPAFCLASSTSSGSVLIPLSGATTTMLGDEPSAATATK